MNIEKHGDKLLWEDYTFLNSFEFYKDIEEAKKQPDTYTVYVPMIVNKEKIVCKLRELIARLGDCDWRNEMDYQVETDKLIRQIEVFDELVKQESGVDTAHAEETVALVKDFVAILMQMTDDDGETYPYEEILELSKEYRLEITEEDIY